MSQLLRRFLRWFVNWLLGEDALRNEIRSRLLAIEAETAAVIAEVRQGVTSGLESLKSETNNATTSTATDVYHRLDEFTDTTLAAIKTAHRAQVEKLEKDFKALLKRAEHLDRVLQRPDNGGLHARRLPPE